MSIPLTLKWSLVYGNGPKAYAPNWLAKRSIIPFGEYETQPIDSYRHFALGDNKDTEQVLEGKKQTGKKVGEELCGWTKGIFQLVHS